MRLDDGGSRRPRAAVFAVVAAAVALRAVYFLQAGAGPYLELHRLEATDMHYYEDWGRRVAGGDWLSSSISMPMHSWHRAIGDEGRWSRWLRPRQFYQDPLYSYLIGVTYRAAGPSVRLVLLGQMALGVATVVLVWALARRFFGEAVGLAAAVLALLCGPLLYYELILLRESMIAFATLALAWRIDRAFSAGGSRRYAVLGAALGLAWLLKSTFLVPVVAVGVALLAVHRRDPRAALRPAAALAAGLALPLGLLAVRNVAVGVPPLALASAGPLTFALSNGPRFEPHLGFAVDTAFVGGVMNETAGRAWPTVAATLRAHTPASYARLLWRKWLCTWHGHEIPNNESFDFMRLRAPVLRWLPFTFALVSPLALVGLPLAVRRCAAAPWPLYLMVAVSLVPLLAFYVLGRFRTGLLAAVLPFAALTLVEAARLLASRRFAAAAVMGAVVALLGWWTAAPPPPGTPSIRADDWMIPFLLRDQPALQAALQAGDAARAVDAYETFFRDEPDEAQLRATGSSELAAALAHMHEHCAALLRDAGRAGDVARQEERARRLHLLSALLVP